MQGKILLASLPESWELMRAAVSNTVGTNKVELKVVVERILLEEVRKLHVGEGAKGAALSVGRGRTGYRDFGNSGRSQSRGRSNSDLMCWGCGKTGHMKRHYKANGDAHVVLSDNSNALVLSVNVSVDSWIVDSRSSFHTTHDRDVMVNYVSGNYGNVHLADGEQLDVVGKSIISVSQLDGDGYRTTFEDGNWKVVRGPMLIAKGQKSAALKIRKVPQLAECNTSFGDEFESEGTLGKDGTGSVLHESSVLVDVFQSRGERYSQPPHYLLTVEGCSDQTSRVNELDQGKSSTWNEKVEERNSLMTNQTWRFSKMPGLNIMKIKKTKAEHGDCLNEGKVQRGRGNGYSRFSLVVKLVSFRDVLGLERKVLKLGSASVGVRG
ncbi:hypothetical protein LIER_18020 [Lithospermum erythrorhizon]|uniref:Retrovirus-related Pol polyprotein from transposon TNT 1-94-like beta-barrel domain-containing protein n=1 Tax=Lithospermum erythrorhizon TaxID=34254 RepID=A0AAV3QDI3_LITER